MVKRKTKDGGEERGPGRPGPPPITLAPLTVDEALEALLKTRPPASDVRGSRAEKPTTRKAAKKR